MKRNGKNSLYMGRKIIVQDMTTTFCADDDRGATIKRIFFVFSPFKNHFLLHSPGAPLNISTSP